MNSAKLPSSMTWCLWFLLAACSDGGEPPPSTGTVVTDSAGVRMVANAGPLWNPGEEWRLTPEPLLSLGVVADTPLVQQFHRIEGLTRLTDGTIVVLNSGSGEVRAFDSSGRHLWSAGGLGQGPGEVSGDGWKTLQRLSGDTLLIRSGLSRITRGPAAPWDGDTDGIYLGTVKLPHDLRQVEIGPDYVLGVATDELGIEQVRLFGLDRGR